MNGLKQFFSAEAAKALVATVVTAVTGVVSLIQVVIADDAISLDEAQGVWLAITTALGTIVAAWSVFKTRNKPAATPPASGGTP